MGGFQRTSVLVGSLVPAVAGCSGGASSLPVVAPGATPSGTATTGGAGGARFSDQGAATAVPRGVRDGVEVIDTFGYRDLATARRNGLARVTGPLSVDYPRTFDQVIAPRVTSMRLAQRGRVSDVGLVTLRGGQAYLLVFGTILNMRGRATGNPAGTPALAEAVVAARRTAVAHVVSPASGSGGVETVAVERAAGSSVDVIAYARGVEKAEGNAGKPRDLQLRFTLVPLRSEWIPGTVHVLPGS